jgi:hypothetical protein
MCHCAMEFSIAATALHCCVTFNFNCVLTSAGIILINFNLISVVKFGSGSGSGCESLSLRVFYQTYQYQL